MFCLEGIRKEECGATSTSNTGYVPLLGVYIYQERWFILPSLELFYDA